MLYTHITIDELTAIPDQERRALLALLMVGLGRLVPTGATGWPSGTLMHLEQYGAAARWPYGSKLIWLSIRFDKI